MLCIKRDLAGHNKGQLLFIVLSCRTVTLYAVIGRRQQLHIMLLRIPIGLLCVGCWLLTCCYSQGNDLFNYRGSVSESVVVPESTSQQQVFLGYFLSPSTLYDIKTKTVKTTVGTICYIPISTDLSQCRIRRGIEEEPNFIDVSENASIDISPSSIQRY